MGTRWRTTMDYRTGLFFLYFLNAVSCIPDRFYSVHLEEKTFDAAKIHCESTGGVLTSISSKDIYEILNAVKDTVKDNKNEVSSAFWIGLKKNKETCVQDNLALKGFHWTVDNSTVFEPNKWRENPEATCTNVLCGLLSVDYSVDNGWGLAAKTCKQTFGFICRHQKPCPEPAIMGVYDMKHKNNDPYTIEIICSNNFILTCSKSTRKWSLKGEREVDIFELCLECEKGYKKSEADGTCVDVNECDDSQICKFKCVNTEGSYQCKCLDDQGKLYNEDSEICKNSTGLFKPTSSSVKREPPPTTPANETIEESTSDLSNIFVPLIIALLIFIVLVVIVLAILKYCLIRRSKKRARERSAAFKESVALNGSDSMEKVNEKEET